MNPKKDTEALEKLNKFLLENNIEVKVSRPSLVQGENGLEFGLQNIVVGVKPEEPKEIVEPEVVAQPD